MNNRSVRSFAFGIFLSASIMGIGYYSQNEPEEEPVTIDTAKAHLVRSGYVIVPKSEYNDLQREITIQEKGNSGQNNPVQETKSADEPPAADPIIPYQLEITSGITPSEIARLLAQNHIIENEQEFTDFLINQNYHTNIQLGSYSLTNQMSHQQLAQIITKR